MPRHFFERLESRSLLSTSFSPISIASDHGAGITPALHASLQTAKPPIGKLSAKPIAAAVSSYTFKVTYHSTAGINAATIATGNLTITGPNGYSGTPALASISPSGNAKVIVAVYSVTPPSGSSFTSADNGSYTISLASGSVRDINNRSAAAKTLGSFKVHIKKGTPTPTPTPTNMIGTYNGTTVVPGFSPTHAVQLTVTSEDAQGNISGSWLTDAGATFSFTGVLAADGTFTYSFMSTNYYHATGPVTGSGTGSGGGTSTLAFQYNATSAGYTAAGTMNVTKV